MDYKLLAKQIQGYTGGKFNIFGGDSIDHYEKKKNMCLILNIYREVEMFESSDHIPLDFCMRDWTKSEVYKRKMDTRDELLARILDAAAAAHINEG